MSPAVLVTGGPTRAYLDEVRYLSNYSTGQLAYAICQALRDRGADVHGVIGPCSPDFEGLGLASLKRVDTVQDMLARCLEVGREVQWGVFSAAVLDFEPAQKATGKVSSSESWTLTLKPTPKIINALHQTYPEMKRIGFKLEWELPQDVPSRDRFAQEKIATQHLDGLVLNSLSTLSDTKHPAWLYPRGAAAVEANSKGEIAQWIAQRILPSPNDL